MSESIAPDTTLWRYMDFTRFVSLFLDESLYFCRVDQLGDPFEGNISTIEYDLLMEDRGSEWEKYRENIFEIYRKSRKNIYVNCWHSNANESAAMWSLYSTQHDGIAIRTDFQSLRDSIGKEQHVFYDDIVYRDYSELPRVDEIKLPHLSKKIEFEHEREIRAYKYGGNPKIKGMPIPVDIGVLVKEVVVAPYAKQWLTSLVEVIVSMAKSGASVHNSQLANAPEF